MRAPLATLLILVVLTVPVAAAHVPRIADGGDAFEDATELGDATKSWAIYGSLDPGGARYFAFDANEADEIVMSVFTPPGSQADFDLALVGPGLPRTDTHGFDIPEGDGIVWAEGAEDATLMFEPFAPSAIRQIAELRVDAPATGRYHIIVQSTDATAGAFSIGLGEQERFTLQEWLATPLRVLQARVWAGQSPTLLFVPFTIGGALALAYGIHRRESARRLAARTAAGLLAGGAALTLIQTALAAWAAPPGAAVLVPLVFAAIALALAWGAIRSANRPRSWRNRAALLAMGIAGLALWAGAVVGPLLLIIAALVPARSIVTARPGRPAA